MLSTIEAWLAHIATLSGKEIDLGLARVHEVAKRLKLDVTHRTVITVAGTNGKGSTVAMLESLFLAAGYNVGTFTSPFLFKLNEEVRINGQEVGDDEFCQAFAKIDAARGDIALTPFEFYTLAALQIFATHEELNILVLEVGLGGRLDAVNVLDADVAVITSIGIDHCQYLGTTREQIALEKFGITRTGKPLVCGDSNPPLPLLQAAEKKQTPIFCQGVAFGFLPHVEHFSFWQQSAENGASRVFISDLPYGALLTQNVATAIMAALVLADKHPFTRAALIQALQQVNLPGRLQWQQAEVNMLYDVAHNPQAMLELAAHLQKTKITGKVYAVFSMLADKDIRACVEILKPWVQAWFIAALPTPRAATLAQLRTALSECGVSAVVECADIAEGIKNAKRVAKQGDVILLSGSFYTVAAGIAANKNTITK